MMTERVRERWLVFDLKWQLSRVATVRGGGGGGIQKLPYTHACTYAMDLYECL